MTEIYRPSESEFLDVTNGNRAVANALREVFDAVSDSNGWSGSFQTGDGKIVTVERGLIVSVS